MSILTSAQLSATWIRGFKPKEKDYDDVWDTMFSISTSAIADLDAHEATYNNHTDIAHANRADLDEVSGTNTGDQYIKLEGIVTGEGSGTFQTAITPNSVDLDRLQTIATQTFVGRNSASVGDVEELSIVTAKTMLGISTIGYKNIRSTMLGDSALPVVTSGTDNTAIGYRALYQTGAGADSNTAIGSQAGYSNVTGDGNVFIGNSAGYSETGSNKLYISNSNTTLPLIKGDFLTRAVSAYGSFNATGGVYDNSVRVVPETRTINGQPLSANITISASSVSGVPSSRTVNSKSLSADIVLNSTDVSAVDKTFVLNGSAMSGNSRTLTSTSVSAVDKTFLLNSYAMSGNSLTLTAADVSAVPRTRTINGISLVTDIVLTAQLVSAVSYTTTVNDKPLTSDIVITTTDIGATNIPNGLEIPSDFTVTYSPSGRSFTLEAASGSAYWLNGVRTLNVDAVSASTSAHNNTTGSYFLYYNDLNVLTVTSTPWNLETNVPIAYAYYNSNTVSALLFDERHPSCTIANGGMSNVDHRYHHLVNGTQYVDGLTVTDYSTVAAPTVAQMQYSVSKGRIVDEDIWITCESSAGSDYAIPDGGAYRVMYRSGATSANEWVWDDAGTMGILPASGASTTIAWNQLNGSTWQRTEMVTAGLGNYVNYWLVAMPVLDNTTGVKTKQVVAIMGQNTHTSLASAQSESSSTLDWGINPQEFVIFGKFTYLAKNPANTVTTLYANIAQFTYVRSNSLNTIINGASPSDHQSLSNRTASGSHPAQAITVIGSGATSADNTVQEAITTLSSAIASAGGSVTVSATYVPTSEYIAFVNQTSGTASTINVSPTAAYFDATTGNLSCTQFTSLSDRNYKENIENISSATDIISSLQGVSFNWKDNGNKAYGVIAQDLEAVIPEAVTEGMDKKSVDYNMIIAFLIESNKELIKRIEILEGR